MNTPALNLFIIDDNLLMTAELRSHLDRRFGNELCISTFLTGKSALRKVNDKTHMVILDSLLKGENANEILRAIKILNPKTEVIMFSSNEDITAIISSLKDGAVEYMLKGDKGLKKITALVYKTISYPVRVMVKEFGLNTYLSMFLVLFLLMGCGICFALQFIS